MSRSLEALKDEDAKKCPREAVSRGRSRPSRPLGACPGASGSVPGLRELKAERQRLRLARGEPAAVSCP